MKLKVAFLTLCIVVFSSIFTYKTTNADDDQTLGKRRNQVLLSPLLNSEKTIMKDAKTGVKVAECIDEYNPYKRMNKKVSDDDILAKAEQKVVCARGYDYNGACWVQSVGFVDGAYRVKVCNAEGSGMVAGAQNNCKSLKDGEVNGLFSAVSKNLGLEDIMYQGDYDDSPTACPYDINNINALGYNYIEEATDSKYKDIDDFYANYCEPLAQRFYVGKCVESSMCPCDTKECKANGFMPNINSADWKNAPNYVKECYQCHKTARAIRFYCQKVYNCIHNNKVNPVVKNLISSQNRKYLKYFYGRGNYMCGYYAGQLCGCAKTKLVGGPRHMLRIARSDNVEGLVCDEGDTIDNPQCNLFSSKIYVRQFYNTKYEDKQNECPRHHEAELGYAHRGTFFFPKMIVKSEEHERKVSLDYNIISHDALFYFNTPIGTPAKYTNNDTLNVYTNAKTDNIIFSHFYPVVFTIGNAYMTKNQDECEMKYSNQVDFFAVRFEYNILTDTSLLVAYSITPSTSKYSLATNADGSISRFTLTKTQLHNAFKYNEDISNRYQKVNGIVYSYDGNNSVKKQNLADDVNYYIFERIGSVIRPPLKYTYDGSTPYIVSPVVIDQDRTSLNDNGDPYATKVMIKVIPSNLEALNDKNVAHPEFEYDIQLPPVKGLNINVAGYTMDALDAMGRDLNKGTNNNALLYFKRFTVDYTTSCKYLLAAQNATFDTTLPELNYTSCDDPVKYATPSEKMNCLTVSLLSQECQGYINCLYTNKSIAECQNSDRKPNIKIYGTNLDDYKINTDFREKTYICLTNGFEFADRLNEFGNVKLYGSFGNSKYDYTIRYQRSSNSKSFLSYPTKPLTKKGRATTVNEINDPADDPRYIMPVFQRYFENTNDEDRYNDLLDNLKSNFKLSEKTNRPTDVSLYDEYAGDCKHNPALCRTRFTVAHRLINETLGNLCLESSGIAGGTWDLPPRDFDTDYQIYIPLRCQYVGAKLYGAGGSGFTSENNTNCIIAFSTYKHEIRTFFIGSTIYWFTVHYRTIPKYDATGGGGGYTHGVIDINKMKVFDGYLNVSIGSATNFVRFILEKHDTGHKCYDGTGGNDLAWGQEGGGHWVVIGGSHKYWNTHYDENGNFQEGRYNKKYMVDEDRGNTMLSYKSYGLSKPPSDEEARLAFVQSQINEAKLALDNANINNITDKANQLYRYKILEYYFVSLYYALQRLSYVDKAYEILEDNVQQQCYNVLKQTCDDAILAKKNACTYDTNEPTTEQINNCQRLTDEATTKCEAVPASKKFLTLSQCSSYSPIQLKKDEAMYLLELANKSYNTEYKSWYVQEKTGISSEEQLKLCEDASESNQTEQEATTNNENQTENEQTGQTTNTGDNESGQTEQNNSCTAEIPEDAAATQITSCEDTSDNEKTEQNNYCKEKQKADSFASDGDSLNDIIEEINTASYYDKIKNYIVNLSNAYTVYTEQINSANEYKKEKNDSYAKNKTISTNNISFNHLSTIITSLKADFLTLYNDAYQFANNNGESSYKTKLATFKSLYDACGSDTDFNSYYPAYMAMSKLVFSLNSAISFCYAGDTEYCETRTDTYDGTTYTVSFDDNKHRNCSNVATALSYYNSNKESDNGDRAIFKEKITLLEEEIEQLLQDATSNIYKLKTNLGDEEEITNKISSASQNTSSDTATMLIKAYRGGSPIDYRIETRAEYGPRYQNNKVSDVKNLNYTRWCYMCFGKYHKDDEYFIDDLFGGLGRYRRDLHITRSQMGTINEDFNITSEEYKTYSANELSRFQAQQGSGSNVAPREHIQGSGGFGWSHKYTVNGRDHSKNLQGIGYPDGTFWANGEKNLDLPYQSTKGNLVNGKYNMWQGDLTMSNGGAFWHRTSTASGGRGNAIISVGDIYMEYNENPKTGNLYPIMDSQGKKQFANSNSQYRTSQCIIRCPPVYVKVELQDFLFEDNSTANLTAICEYTGTPTEDMEIRNGTSVHPNKCYIISDYTHPIYGKLKGKVIRRMGFCPIAKCENGTWSLTESTGVSDDLFQYDRKAMLCKYKTSYDEVKNKSPWYFHMAFDSNIYASMAFKGGLGTSLDAELIETGRSYKIATCVNNGVNDFIEDVGTQLDSDFLQLYCKNGFWFSKVIKENNQNYQLYDKTKTYSTQFFTAKSHLSSGGSSSAPWATYTENFDADRNTYYENNNADMYAYEYFINDIEKAKTMVNGGSKISSGVEKKKIAGREIFRDKVYCPPIIDLYDFDKTYSGNATWNETKEYGMAYGRCRNKAGDDTKYFQSPKGQPYRACMRNGMWGPVFNSCLQSCKDEEKNGTLWSVFSLGDNITPNDDGKVVVYGACSGNYLNSQNLITTQQGRSSRECNLNTGIWGEIKDVEGGCKDTLGCPIDNMQETSVITPFFKIIDVKEEDGLYYTDIVNNIRYNSTKFEPERFLSYDESLYLMFEDEKQDCTINETPMKCLVGKEEYLDVSYEVKNLSASENNSFILDPQNNRLIKNFENNNFVILTIKNTFKPDAYNYMKNPKDNRNAFLSMYNWIYDLKNINKNYTGQWSWDSCNLSTTSKLIYSNNNTSDETQETYKNSYLSILIPVLTATDNEEQTKKQAKMVAMFSPRLAVQYYNLTNEELPQEERNILFRIPEKIPVELQLPEADPVPIIISTPFRNKRLYDIELKKTNTQTTRGDNYTWTNQQISDNEHTPNRDCYGEYIGYINHNTMKNIFYTPHPTSQDKYFISAFCYDGHIFGYKAFQVGFTQLMDLSDAGCFLQPTANGDNSAQKFYTYMNNKYPDAVKKDTQAHTMELNAYIAKMAGKYWSNFLQPEGKIRELFVENYSKIGSPGSSVFVDTDDNIKYVLEQYEKGSHGYYYRVVPRRFEWITSNNLSLSELKVHDLLKLDDNDPYCDQCDHTDADNINTEVNGTVWKMCETSA